MSIPKSPKLLGIQVARGVAALMIVLYHGGRMLSLPQYVGHIPLGDFFRFGHAGVDFFFVLSGFIIFFVHRPDIGRPRQLPRYVWRRVTRIYPIYWIVTGIIVLLGIFSRHGMRLPSLWNFAASMLLLPQRQAPLLGVAWTLEHEMLFYTIFAVAILSARGGIALFAGWMALVLAGLLAAPSAHLLRFFAASYHLQFMIGIAAAWCVRNRTIPVPKLWAGLGVAAFFTIAMMENANLFLEAGPLSQMLFGLAAAAILIGLAASEQRGLIWINPMGALFGAASYSLYLVHTIIIGLTARAMTDTGIIHHIPEWLSLIVVVVASVVGGASVHALIERPIMARLHHLPAGRRAVEVPTPLS